MIVIAVIMAIVFGSLLYLMDMKDGKMKRFLKTSDTICGIMTLAVICGMIMNVYSGKGYEIEAGGLFESIRYVGNYEGYQLYTVSDLRGSVPYYAVAENNVDVSPLCHKGSEVMILRKKGTVQTESTQTIRVNGTECRQAEDVVGIRPDYTAHLILGAVLIMLYFFVSNCSCMIISFGLWLTEKSRRE